MCNTQRAAKAKCIDKKGVRLNCGDGSDSKAEVGRVAVFSTWCHPHTPLRPYKQI